MEPGWVPMFAGKCSAAEVLPKQLLMLPSPNSVSGGILLPAGTCPEWEEIGEGQTGDRRGGRGIGVGAGTCLSSPPRPTIPSRHSCRCSYQPENFFQLMVKPKEHCPSSSKCWELTRWDGSMGFWALDTAAWYSPEKLPWLSASGACILEPSSFSHQPVTSYCGGKSRCVLGGCLHTDPTPAPQAEPPTRTPPSAHGVPTPALPGELCDPRTHLPVPVATCAASAPVHGTSARHQWGAHWDGQSPRVHGGLLHSQGSGTARALQQPTCKAPAPSTACPLPHCTSPGRDKPPPWGRVPRLPLPQFRCMSLGVGIPTCMPPSPGKACPCTSLPATWTTPGHPPPSEQPAWQELPSASHLELGVLLLLRIPSTDGSSMSVPPQTLGPPRMLPCSLPQG